MDTQMPNFESKEAPDFDLGITLTRHGPKSGIDGPLSDKGLEDTREYFADAYENVPIDEGRERRVVSSPKDRAQFTADSFQSILRRDQGLSPVNVESEEALGEWDIMKYYDLLSEEDKKNWFAIWYNQEKNQGVGLTPKEVSCKFYNWLLKEINDKKIKGGNSDIDAFTHGPLMAAVLLCLEDELKQDILTRIDDPQRLDRTKLMDQYNGILRTLQNVNFHISSKDPLNLKLSFLGKTNNVPLSTIEKLAKIE